ncbi:MTAP family purine nucleoside phosphorylase [bacterium]|nr:MTAP family purine nucleoside phosphorylase [bacterium]MBU2461347.1 MTAP family purine nucleoside phosphorylase [bacterium]
MKNKMKAIIAGFSLDTLPIFSRFKEERIETEKGKAIVFVKNDWVFLPRHGPDKTISPHMINHAANILSLKELGVEACFSINSTGSLKLAISPQDFLVPCDYFCLWPKTFYDDRITHIVPELNRGLRKIIIDVARKAGLNPIDGGIYVQTRGPRLETKAEIKFLQGVGDVVGMTMANEATISQELDIPYASLCSIDNYCNGIIEKPLTLEEMKANSSQKIEKLKAFLIKLL